MERLGESMAEELTGHGIVVNSLDPGWVLTRPNETTMTKCTKVCVYLAT